MPTVAELFNQAVSHHQSGNLKEAEALYRQVLQLDHFHADGRHLLGLLAHQTGHHDAAIYLIRQAIALMPNVAAFHSNLGTVLQAAARAPEAFLSFERAVQLDPHFADAHNNLGNALVDLGRITEALDHFRQAISIVPDHATAHYNLANALRSLGQAREAVAAYRRTLQINPRHAQAHNNLGLALRDLGDPQASECYRQALALSPEFVEARLNLGNALRARGQTAEAIACYREVVVQRPDYVDALSNLGLTLKDQDDQGAEAIAVCEKALALDPNHVPTYVNLGTVYFEQGRLDEAAVNYDQAIRLAPAETTPRYNRALLRLLTGDFERAWPDYECRWQERGAIRRTFAEPRWDGSSLDGKTILLHAEQGLGDTIQFCRYATLVKERGGTVILECQPELVDLLQGISDRVIAKGEPLPAFDCHVPLLSLPGIFQTTLATIPAQVPYLSVQPDAVNKWAAELAPLTGLKIGIAWQGNPEHDRDRHRSVPLTAFKPLAEMPGASLVSLQKGPGTEQLGAVKDGWPILDLGDRLESFLDTAGVMANLDLIVTIDSAVAHLAGALGLRVWVLLPHIPDWRWLMGRSDSPWYPTMRLFRQARPGAWGEVFHQVAQGLRSNALAP